MSDKISPYIQDFMAAKELPGLAAGVVKDGEVLLAKGFGVLSIVDKTPVTARHLFHMASVSKPFAATGTMQLVEKGKIELEKPVLAYLPYFEMADERYKAITIQQMLSHTSGMPDVLDYEWGNPYAEDDAMEKYIRSLTSQKLKFDPGSEFAYSNIAFEILGDIISKTSGLTFEEYIKRYIFLPLGMDDSTFLRADVPVELRVTPHTRLFEVEVSRVYPYNRAHAPSSTLHSNALEMCKWMIANIRRGEYDGKRILQRASYDLLWKPWMQTTKDQAGLSWFIGVHRDLQTIGHGGSDTGFRSQLLMIPEKGIGVTVMCNLNPAPLEELAGGILDLLLGETPPAPLKPAFFEAVRVYQASGYDAALNFIQDLKSKPIMDFDFNPEPFLMLGFSLVNDGKSEQALDLLKIAQQIVPDSAVVIAGLAYLYFNTNESELANSHIERALAMEPDNFIVKYIQGMMKV
jgi:CubicO group peptidase (beta-lactamase class C family)